MVSTMSPDPVVPLLKSYHTLSHCCIPISAAILFKKIEICFGPTTRNTSLKQSPSDSLGGGIIPRTNNYLAVNKEGGEPSHPPGPPACGGTAGSRRRNSPSKYMVRCTCTGKFWRGHSPQSLLEYQRAVGHH